MFQISHSKKMRSKSKKINKGITLIKKSNNLIESRYKFDIWETRFFLSVLSQIKRSDEEFEVYRIWYKDVIKSFGLKSGDSYAHLRSAAQSLMSKSFFVSYEDGDVIREKQYHILREIDYLQEGQEGKKIENHEYVDVTVEQKMKPLLLQLQKNFTAYDLQNIVKLGVYPVRVYELLKQYQSIGKRMLEVEEMKKMFEVTEQYRLFGDFYRWIVKPAIKQINKYTDLTISEVEKIKEGRRVVALRFVFHAKDEIEINKIRNALKPKPKQLPIEFKDNLKAIKQKGNNNSLIFDELYPLVQKWVSREALEMLLKDYPTGQVKKAITYTINKLKRGDNIQNVTGYIVTMAQQKELIDPIESQRNMMKAKRQRQKEREAKKAFLEQEKKKLYEELRQKENMIIEAIFMEVPDTKKRMIDLTKQSRFSHYKPELTDQENLQDPIFKAAFCNTVKKQFASRFELLGKKYEGKVKIIQATLNGL